MQDGPYTKLGAIASVLALVIGYLTLADSTRWFPFNEYTRPPTSSGVTPTVHEPSSRLDDVWVAQLASVPVGAGTSQLSSVLMKVRREIPGARYLSSSSYRSLKAGFWMIYYPGSFSNGNQALAFCAAHGRTTRDQCIGRFVSHRATDRSYMCFPPAGSQSTGCYRRLATTAK